MTRAALYSVLRDVCGEPLLIRDEGSWDQHPTITNAAEAVVAQLVASGRLPAGRRLFYQDSAGDVDEMLVRGGALEGFAPGAHLDAAFPVLALALRARLAAEVEVHRKQIVASLRALAREAGEQAMRIDVLPETGLNAEPLNGYLQAVTISAMRAWAKSEFLNRTDLEALPARGGKS